jgi:2-oxoglutarate dehydrogenase complex dehydrogenase (E1) component-like enzyme
VICSGKVFFDIDAILNKDSDSIAGKSVKVIRVEEIAPFPVD